MLFVLFISCALLLGAVSQEVVTELVTESWTDSPTVPCGSKPPQTAWSSYIVSGRDAESGAWPWQVSIQYYRDDRTWYHTCGGVLIHGDWVLTAAHCTMSRADPTRFRIIAGAHNIKDLDGTEQVIDVDLIIQHKWFIPFPPLGYPNDIGLLRLAHSVDMDAGDVDLACIPDDSHGDFAGNPDCWISGWGLTKYNNADIPEILQEANVPIPTVRQCRLWYSIILRQSHICAGTGRPNACSGDSGGPMSCKIGDMWYVAGVTSFGPFFCFLLPAVYTRISHYHDWIETNIANNARTPMYSP